MESSGCVINRSSLHGSVCSCCIAVPTSVESCMCHLAGDVSQLKLLFKFSLIHLRLSCYSCFHIYHANMLCSGEQTGGLLQVTFALLFALFLCSTMMLQNSVRICPGSLPICEESWVSLAAMTTLLFNSGLFMFIPKQHYVGLPFMFSMFNNICQAALLYPNHF